MPALRALRNYLFRAYLCRGKTSDLTSYQNGAKLGFERTYVEGKPKLRNYFVVYLIQVSLLPMSRGVVK